MRRFLAWAASQQLELHRVTPGLVGQYLDQLDASIPTRKQHLAALRGFFDKLVLRHVVVLNPAASVRGERYSVTEGKTPEIAIDQARRLLGSIDTSHVVGLRDRAIVAVLIYTAARIGAVSRLRRKTFATMKHSGACCFMKRGGKPAKSRSAMTWSAICWPISMPPACVMPAKTHRCSARLPARPGSWSLAA